MCGWRDGLSSNKSINNISHPVRRACREAFMCKGGTQSNASDMESATLPSAGVPITPRQFPGCFSRREPNVGLA